MELHTVRSARLPVCQSAAGLAIAKWQYRGQQLGERMEQDSRKRSGSGAGPGVDSREAGGVGAAGVDAAREPGARNHHPVPE